MSRRIAFVSALSGTAAVMFLAQRVEYLGFEYMKAAGFLALGTVIGTIALIILAARMFTDATAIEVALESASLAGFPFLIQWLLGMNGTQLNIHGFAMAGYFIYLFGSEACAIVLVIAIVVRSAIRWTGRHAARLA